MARSGMNHLLIVTQMGDSGGSPFTSRSFIGILRNEAAIAADPSPMVALALEWQVAESKQGIDLGIMYVGENILKRQRACSKPKFF